MRVVQFFLRLRSRSVRDGGTPIRFADLLAEERHVSVTHIVWSEGGHVVQVRDHRFNVDYELTSHCDFWDLIVALDDGKQFLRLPLTMAVA